MRRMFLIIMSMLFLVGILFCGVRVLPVEASYIIYIRADGSIDPPTAPVSTVDNVAYTLTDNILTDTWGIVVQRDGIVFDGAEHTIQCTMLNGPGILLSETTNVTITNINIVHFLEGMYLNHSSFNRVLLNTLTEDMCGVYLIQSHNNSVSSNTVVGNKNTMAGILLDYACNNTIEDNSANDATMYGISIQNTSSGNIVLNNSASGNGAGIGLHSFDNLVSHNNLTGNSEGIYFGEQAHDDTVSENVATGNSYGMYLYRCSNVTISSNNMTGNFDGVTLGDSCSNVTISDNAIASNSGDGISLVSSSNNMVVNNNVSANNEGIKLSIYIGPCSNNAVFHNCFIGNALQADSSGVIGHWDDGYPFGGNYWSDYGGVDENSGPNQDQLGSDGLGDTPYVIDSSNQDEYPLMEKWPLEHEIAVLNVIPFKDYVGQGCETNVTVSLVNWGTQPENFNITVFANGTLIRTFENTVLANGDGATMTFTWNTTGFARGSYILSANATVLEGEVYTADNRFTDGPVLVTFVGDVNGDGKVRIDDVLAVASRFGTNMGGPPNSNGYYYDANCDITSDAKIRIDDVLLAARHFGQGP
jgi:parallel beta-helix repeat protein